MTASILELITNASRPWKSFETTFGDETIKLFTRRLSSAETSSLQDMYSQELSKAREELEHESGDMTLLRHNFSRQSNEKLVDFILQADRADYLNEASSELDDAKLDDPKVIQLAEAKMEEARTLLLKGDSEELLDMAVDRRSMTVATIKASTVRNNGLLYYACYIEDEDKQKVKLFPSIEYITNELDQETILRMLSECFTAMGATTQADPLKPAAKVPARKRSSSPKPLAEE